jgi:hypothetical protein
VATEALCGAENGIFFEFSLCLSRACLGKMIVFIYKWLKNAVFRRAASGRGGGEAAVSLHACGLQTGKKNVLFAPFIYKNDHFTKTGSGQT